MDRDQRIRDPIHNLIAFSTKRAEDEILWSLLTSSPVQRLRRIKQLGFSEFVYPGATHSRFSHVLGAMQMARRMLDVFERNAVFTASDSKHQKMRKATLAAALLHDVGHGPYSHVFEEVSSHVGLDQRHEKYTIEILDYPEVKKILTDAGIYKETKKFFTTEAGYDPYTRIISSQMDCDRLDFLVRDRYYTGIRSAAIDLMWLFDSLSIENVPVDPVRQIKAYSFVVLPKGLSVVEEFVLAYMKMYQNVYFHKTTRAVQHMVTDIIKALVIEAPRTTKNVSNHPLLKFFKSKKSKSIDRYLAFDDSSVTSLLRALADSKTKKLSDLAQRYFCRDTYKCIELPTYSSGEVRRAISAKFIEALQEKKLDFFHDNVPQKSYKQYELMDEKFLQNILVKKDGEFEPLGWHSEIAKNAPAKSIRIYFRSDFDRDKAQKLLKKLTPIAGNQGT